MSLDCNGPYSNKVPRQILSSEEFKRFILLLVQDAEESRNQDQSHCPPYVQILRIEWNVTPAIIS